MTSLVGELGYQHCVAVGVEAVTLVDGELVPGFEAIDADAGEGGDHGEEGGSWEVEVGHEGVGVPEGVWVLGAVGVGAGGDEQSGVGAVVAGGRGGSGSDSRARTVVVPTGMMRPPSWRVCWMASRVARGMWMRSGWMGCWSTSSVRTGAKVPMPTCRVSIAVRTPARQAGRGGAR